MCGGEGVGSLCVCVRARVRGVLRAWGAEAVWGRQADALRWAEQPMRLTTSPNGRHADGPDRGRREFSEEK